MHLALGAQTGTCPSPSRGATVSESCCGQVAGWHSDRSMLSCLVGIRKHVHRERHLGGCQLLWRRRVEQLAIKPALLVSRLLCTAWCRSPQPALARAQGKECKYGQDNCDTGGSSAVLASQHVSAAGIPSKCLGCMAGQWSILPCSSCTHRCRPPLHQQLHRWERMRKRRRTWWGAAFQGVQLGPHRRCAAGHTPCQCSERSSCPGWAAVWARLCWPSLRCRGSPGG